MKKLVVFALVIGGGCSAEVTAPPPPPKPHVVAAQPAGVMAEVLKGYEDVRRALAADDVAAAHERAVALKRSTDALNAETAAPPPQAAALAAAAGGLVLGESDLVKARAAFGELSRAVVAVVAADPSLQPGRFLFQCPMAKGYQRWVQLEEKMANPYMGKRMLECGEVVSVWKV